MERIKELKEEAYKMAMEKGYIHDWVYPADIRLKAMEVYALLTDVEKKSQRITVNMDERISY